MKQTEKKPEQICDIRVYDDLPLPMIMVQGWFNDQHDCFRLFLEALTVEEQTQLFRDQNHFEKVKAKYRKLWDDGTFKGAAIRVGGPHKLPDQLWYGHFSDWTKCVFDELATTGDFEALLRELGTVEAAHDRFKPWFYRTKKVRNLNAADAARILACYGYLQPEERPLLARGALRGAAILLYEEPPYKRVNKLEAEYQDESKRRGLEELAAAYINENEELSQAGKWRMQEGESWFCEAVHKVCYPER